MKEQRTKTCNRESLPDLLPRVCRHITSQCTVRHAPVPMFNSPVFTKVKSSLWVGGKQRPVPVPSKSRVMVALTNPDSHRQIHSYRPRKLLTERWHANLQPDRSSPSFRSNQRDSEMRAIKAVYDTRRQICKIWVIVLQYRDYEYLKEWICKVAST